MVRAYWPGLAAFKEACVKRCRWILLNFSTINVVVYCYYYYWLKKNTAEIEETEHHYLILTVESVWQEAQPFL